MIPKVLLYRYHLIQQLVYPTTSTGSIVLLVRVLTMLFYLKRPYMVDLWAVEKIWFRPVLTKENWVGTRLVRHADFRFKI